MLRVAQERGGLIVRTGAQPLLVLGWESAA